MAVLLTNNVASTLASSLTTSSTSLTVATGTGAKFPSPVAPDYFYATIISTTGEIEIVKVTSRANDVMTIVRAQDSTTAKTFPSKSRIEARINAKSVLDAVDDGVAESVATMTVVTNALDTRLDTAEAKLARLISVRDYGAVGNGTTDDTAAIQAAVNAVASATNGGSVFFPAGTYKITDTITINRSINLVGESIQGTNIHLYVSTPKPAFYFDGTVNIHFGGGISNMWIRCDYGAVSGDGIKLKATTPAAITTAAIRDIVVYGARDGVVLEGTSANEVYLCTVENVKVIGTALNGAGANSLRYGFYVNAASYNSFRNCEATNIGNAGWGFRATGIGTMFDNITTDGVAFINCAFGSINQWTVETIQATTPVTGEALNIVAALSVNNVTLIDVLNAKCNVGVKLFSYTTLSNLRIDGIGSAYPAYPISLDSGSSGVISNCSGFKTYFIEQYHSAALLDKWTFINSPDFTRLSVRQSVLNVKNFGAIGDGVANDTAAFIAAHAALPASGGAIYIPAGNYNVEATVAFTKPVYMYGDGGALSVGASRILCNTPSIDVFTTTNILSCYNFAIQGQTTNTLFKQLNTATNHAGTSFSNLAVLNCYRFFESQASLVFTVRNCWIGGFVDAGICINNGAGTFGDQGDSYIVNNAFISGGASSAAIDVIRGAGFWISGNKFNASVGIAHLRLNVTEATGNILVENNSFEGQPTYAIEASSAFTVTKLVATGNQFSGGVSRHINLTGNVFEAVIANNTFNGLSSTPASPETGIYVGDLPRDITIQGNNFHKIDACITLLDSSAKILDNTFGDDVARYVTGTIKDVFNFRQSYSRHYLSRYIENTSNSVWKTIYKITGVSVTLEIMIEGFVQGVGALQAYYKTFNGANVVTPIVTGAGASAFSFQITAGGEIQFRLNGVVGTNAQITPRIVAVGGIANVTFT